MDTLPSRRSFGDRWSASPTIQWLIEEAWRIQDIAELTKELGDRLNADGLPVMRLFLVVPTLHPRVAGRGYIWRRHSGEITVGEGTHADRETERFQNSPIRLIMNENAPYYRSKLTTPDYAPGEFGVLDEIVQEGGTDYVVLPLEFTNQRKSVISFSTDDPNGFSDEAMERLCNLRPLLARLIERETLHTTAVNLLDTYVGHRTGEYILEGGIRRGTTMSLKAVLWFSDLRGFTTLSERHPPEVMVDALNQYFDVLAGPIAAQGGEILKFIGDGMMAIFPITDSKNLQTCARSALQAAIDACQALDEANCDRLEAGSFPLECGVALNVGEVMYGNIGSADRLDFTVVGPAVNLTQRLEDVCKLVDQRIVVSKALKDSCGCPVKPIGSFRLRGIAESQPVFVPDLDAFGVTLGGCTAEMIQGSHRTEAAPDVGDPPVPLPVTQPRAEKMTDPAVGDGAAGAV